MRKDGRMERMITSSASSKTLNNGIPINKLRRSLVKNPNKFFMNSFSTT